MNIEQFAARCEWNENDRRNERKKRNTLGTTVEHRTHRALEIYRETHERRRVDDGEGVAVQQQRRCECMPLHTSASGAFVVVVFVCDIGRAYDN